MSTPDERKTMQVSPSVHTAVHDLATRLGTSADGALRHLLDKSTIRVHLTPKQRDRWGTQADAMGVHVSSWVVLQVEDALRNNPVEQSRTLAQVFYRVDLLCQAANLKTPPVGPSPGTG